MERVAPGRLAICACSLRESAQTHPRLRNDDRVRCRASDTRRARAAYMEASSSNDEKGHGFGRGVALSSPPRSASRRAPCSL